MTPRPSTRSRRAAIASAAALAVTMAGAAPAVAADSPAAAASNASAAVVDGTLTITGTNGPDTVGILELDPNTLQVSLGNNGDQRFDRSTFTTIDVALRGGDDQLAVIGNTVGLSVDGGPGNDQIRTGGGNDVIEGGGGDDMIQAGGGDDTILGGAGDDVVSGGQGHDTAFLDGGDDTFVWNPGDASDSVDGGGGQDTMQFNGSNAAETMSLSASGRDAVFTRDVGTVRMDMDDIETMAVTAQGSADHVTIGDMTGTDIRQTDVDLSGNGADDQAADVVTVNGSDKADRIAVTTNGGAIDVAGLKTAVHMTGGHLNDLLQVDALGGNDAVTVAPDVATVMGVTTDLGTGQR